MHTGFISLGWYGKLIADCAAGNILYQTGKKGKKQLFFYCN
jgi:hypothetical protein